MKLKTRLFGKSYAFASVREVLARANEPKSGDHLAGIAARDQRERVAAKMVLADLTLNDLRENPVVPYERDEVTRLIDDHLDRDAFARIRTFPVGQFREWLLDEDRTGDDIAAISRGLTGEMAAALAKLCSNLDLITIAAKIRVVTQARTTLGLAGRLSTRLQPNHPADDSRAIAAAIYEGLAYGCGDAIIGINPCIDEPDNIRRLSETTAEIIARLQVPAQNCVLGHLTTQLRALNAGAPIDILFQSLAGTQKGNSGFGITVAMLDEGAAAIRERGALKAPNLTYFETGQGSELSAKAHESADQLTLEARCYGLARHYSPVLVNTVVGFIGPEYLYDARQITRAGLEDHLMGKLMGVPHGADACYTNHARADQNDCENLAVLLAAAGCNYFMAVPMGDDVMLSYQCTSYHDGAALRELLRMRPAPEFEQWCERRGILREGRLSASAGFPVKVFGREADGDIATAMRAATPARLRVGRASSRYTTTSQLQFRADHARAVDAVITEVAAGWARKHNLLEVCSRAQSRKEFLLNPDLGRQLSRAGVEALSKIVRSQKRKAADQSPRVLLCIADGLSSHAVERNGPALLHALERKLKRTCRLLPPVFVRNGRVRIQDQIGELLRPDVICMLVGERPGLATAESLSAYVIYKPRARSAEPDRTVVSNIHPEGLAIAAAAAKIAALISDAVRHRASGAKLATLLTENSSAPRCN